MNLISVLFLVGLMMSLYDTSTATEQLSFSGGGAFGAVEIGIIKKLHENHSIRYDRYTGISAGGLNSGFLSHFENIQDGIAAAEHLYSTIRNHDVYEVLPDTGVSLLNTKPLYKTLTNVVSNMKSQPVVDTLIGTVNLYTGNLDTFTYDHNLSTDNKVLLLMSTSAIPIAFPPVKFNNYLYADGGTLSNELLDVVHSSNYLNITYISPYGPMDENDTPIRSIKDMVMRTLQIVKKNFNNPFAKLNRDCENPYGEITYFYVDKADLKGYSMLNFDKGAELIEIGYTKSVSKKYKLC